MKTVKRITGYLMLIVIFAAMIYPIYLEYGLEKTLIILGATAGVCLYVAVAINLIID